MDIKAKIQQVLDKLLENDKLMEKFKKNPVPVIEELLGVDLPDDLVEKIIQGVRAKIDLEKVGDALDKLSGLLRK